MLLMSFFIAVHTNIVLFQCHVAQCLASWILGGHGLLLPPKSALDMCNVYVICITVRTVRLLWVTLYPRLCLCLLSCSCVIVCIIVLVNEINGDGVKDLYLALSSVGLIAMLLFRYGRMARG